MNRENKQSPEHLKAMAEINRYNYNCTPEKPIFLSSAISYDIPDAKPWMDLHAELEIYIHLSGSARRIWEGLSIDVKPGDVCFAGAYELHGYQLLDVPVQGVVIEISPSLLTDAHFPEYPDINWMALFTMPPEKRPRATPQMRSRVLELSTRLLSYGQGDEAPARVYRRLALFELLTMFENEEASAIPRPHQQPEAYAKLAPAIELATHSKKLVSNSEAAAACRMPRNQFIMAFEKNMGVSFSRFALRHRIDAAHKIIVFTDKPIKAVAEELGFANVSHLHRLFVAHYHSTPVEFRQRMKERTAYRNAMAKTAGKTAG